MNFIVWVYLALAIWPNAFAIYYTRKQEVFQPTNRHLRNNSYFGYSITYDEISKKLIISAPRENSIGEVYNCNIENRDCKPIVNHIERVSANYTHDYWFGATVKAGPNFVMMCAPRYTDFHASFATTKGSCYSYTNGRLTRKRMIRDSERKQGKPDDRLNLGVWFGEHIMDSFGWSIDVASDDSILVGGPGMYHGRAMIYSSEYGVPKLIPPTNTTEFNFGYAVASGMFINHSLSYAVSSPYGTGGRGEVAFYAKSSYSGVTYLRKLIDHDSQVGSMFGAVLCAAKLLANRTDLLVGAPTYATKTTYNLGAVYVYLSHRPKRVPDFHRRIVGEVSGSMFGSAIVTVGDLNGDQKDEIAIGAPFEDGYGVVYLYSGADLISELNERNLKYLQRIVPETSYGESFGLSLTPLQIDDKNGCKELAIGSPYKNTVVLLRCMAAVIVETSVNFPSLQGRTSLNKTDFEFEVCLSVKYPRIPENIRAVVSTSVAMDHDYAKLTDTKATEHFTYNTVFDEKKPEYCNNVSFVLPLDGKYEKKISYTVSSRLLDDPGTLPDFNISRVILNDRSVLTLQGLLWAAECAGNETCVPNLFLTSYISFHDDDDPYIIGSSETETMNITIHNDGEVAYDPCVRMDIVGAKVLTTPTGCVYDGPADGNSLLCEPPKPIRISKTWTTSQIFLDMTHLTSLVKSIIINMFIFDRCEDVFTKIISIIVPVKADPRGINIKGETDIGPIVNLTKEDIEENGKKMQHVYTITNEGPTNWKGLQVLVTLLKKPYVKYDDSPVTVYFSTSNLYPACPIVSQDNTTVSCICVINSLVKRVEFAKILIPMNIVPGSLDGILDKDKNVTIMSSIKLQFIDDDYKVESITTNITLQDSTTIPILEYLITIDSEVIEIIIIAVVVGLCILFIITLILYWIGFLRRKKKDALKHLKLSVKRQAILKRTFTMQSQASAGNHRNPILHNQENQKRKRTEAFK